MKQKLIFFIIVLINLKSNAQLTKNNWMLGGNLSFITNKASGSSTSENKYRELNLSPMLGYFIVDKLAIGVKSQYYNIFESYIVTTTGFRNSTRQNRFGIGPFARYYFLNTSKKLNLFFEGNFSTNRNVAILLPNTRLKSNSTQYSFNLGSAYFLNLSTAFEFIVGYQSFKETQADIKTKGLKINIGMQFHLEKE